MVVLWCYFANVFKSVHSLGLSNSPLKAFFLCPFFTSLSQSILRSSPTPKSVSQWWALLGNMCPKSQVYYLDNSKEILEFFLFCMYLAFVGVKSAEAHLQPNLYHYLGWKDHSCSETAWPISHKNEWFDDFVFAFLWFFSHRHLF